MKAHNLSFPNVAQILRWNGPTSTVIGVRSTDTFTFSGFGPGDFSSPTPGSFTKDIVFNLRGTLYGKPLPNSTQEYRNYVAAYNKKLPPEQWGSLEQRAIYDFYDKIRGSLDLSVALAESGETARMIKAAGKLRQLISNIGPNKWSKAWLSYQYGWRPLVDTAYDAYNKLHQAAVGAFRVEVKVKDESDGVRFELSPLGSSAFCRYKWTDSQRVLVQADYFLQDGVAETLAGYGTLNPASIAWELVPYSFVADWFLNIGGYMRALESSIIYHNQLRNKMLTRTRAFSEGGMSWGSNSIYSSHLLRGSREYKYKLRSTTFSFLPPLPRFTAKLGWQRVLSASALLYEAVKR